MASRRFLLLVTLAVLAPVAAAAPATGSFTVAGPLRTPSGTEGDATALGLFLRNEGAEGLASFELHARQVNVHRYFRTAYEARGPGVNPSTTGEAGNATYVLHDVRVTLEAGDHAGYLGLYFPAGGRPLGLQASGPATVRAVPGASLGDETDIAVPEPEGPQPDSDAYGWSTDAPVLLSSLAGVFRQEGNGMVKVRGADLRLASRENTTVLRTGVEHSDPDAPVGTITYRWAFLEFVDATLAVETREPFSLASADAFLGWTGEAVFSAVEGSLDTAGSVHRVEREDVRVSGHLSARLSPRDDGQRMQLSVSGDLSESSLTGPSAPAPVVWSRWGGALGVATGALLAALLLALLLRRPRRDPLEPDERVGLAHLAAERERFHEALEHVRQARRQAPGSVRLLLEEASYLGATGQVEEALACYEEAARLDPACDAEFQAAVLLLRGGGAPDRAEALLVEALRKSPILVLEVAYDGGDTFDALRGRPAFEEAVEEARRAMGE